MSGTRRPVVYFHIGAPKTGTTYLQHVLHQNRDALRRDGVLYPGTAPSHFWASLDLRETGFKGHRPPGSVGAWKRVVDELRSWDGGTAVIDHENFARATPAQVDRALADLSFAEVHVVLTARDMARQLPTTWQERMKNRETQSYADFLRSVRKAHPERSGSGRVFWEAHDPVGVLGRWARDVPPERVHVVTVPPSGSEPGLLWKRFAGLLGLDPDRYDTDTGPLNTSLGAVEAAVLHEVNVTMAEDPVPWPVHAKVLKHNVAGVLAARPGPRIALPEDAYAWAVDWSRRTVADLADAGYDVVGDLDELVPATCPTGLDPDDVPDGQRAEAAVAGMAALLRERAASERRRRRSPVDRLRRGSAGPPVNGAKGGARAVPGRTLVRRVLRRARGATG